MKPRCRWAGVLVVHIMRHALQQHQSGPCTHYVCASAEAACLAQLAVVPSTAPVRRCRCSHRSTTVHFWHVQALLYVWASQSHINSEVKCALLQT